LRRDYAFTFPQADGLLYGGLAISALISLIAADVIWIAGTARGVNRAGRIPSRASLRASLATAICVFTPLAWISLLAFIQLEPGIERFWAIHATCGHT
jgi:hypothetical protein